MHVYRMSALGLATRASGAYRYAVRSEGPSAGVQSPRLLCTTTLAHTCPHPPTPAHTSPHLPTPVHTCPHLSASARTCPSPLAPLKSNPAPPPPLIPYLPLAGVYRVLAYILGQCTVVSGPNTNCKATVLANVNAFLSAELCYDGRY